MSKQERLQTWAGFALVSCLAFAVRAFWIGRSALWLDETFTITYARESVSHLVSLTRVSDVHPPLYYLIVKAAAELFGEGSGIWLRLISVLAGSLSAGVMYLFAKRWFGLKVAIYAGLFFILLPINVHYSRELRTYSLLSLLLLGALVCFVEMIAPGEDTTPRRRKRFAVGYVVTLALTFHLHYSSVVFFPLFGLSALLVWKKTRNAQLLRLALGSTVAAGLLCLPQAFHFVWARAHTADDFWILATTPEVFYRVSMGAYPFPFWAKPFVLAAYVTGAVLLWRKIPELASLAFVFLIGGPLTVAFIGIFSPAYLVRTIQAYTVLSPLLIGLAMTVVPRKAGPAVAVALAAFHVLAFVRDYPAEQQILKVDQIAPILAEMEVETVYFHDPLERELDLRHVDREGWVVTRLADREILADAEARLAGCATSGNCGPIAIVMEREPLFQVEDGEFWMEGMDRLSTQYDARTDRDVAGMRVLVFERQSASTSDP